MEFYKNLLWLFKDEEKGGSNQGQDNGGQIPCVDCRRFAGSRK